MSKNQVTFLVSFTVEGKDPRSILAQQLHLIDNDSISEIEIVEDDEFDFIGGLEDEFYFGDDE